MAYIFNNKKLSEAEYGQQVTLAYAQAQAQPYRDYKGKLSVIPTHARKRDIPDEAARIHSTIAKNPKKYHKLLEKFKADKALKNEIVEELHKELLLKDITKWLKILTEAGHENTPHFNKILSANTRDELERMTFYYRNFAQPGLEERVAAEKARRDEWTRKYTPARFQKR